MATSPPIEPEEQELIGARRALLTQPWRAAVATAALWGLVAPPVLYLDFQAIGETNQSIADLYLADCPRVEHQS